MYQLGDVEVGNIAALGDGGVFNSFCPCWLHQLFFRCVTNFVALTRLLPEMPL